MAKKVEQKKEILTDSEALAGRLGEAEDWMERHPRLIIGIVAVLLVGAVGYFGFNYYKRNLEKEAQLEMYQAVFYFESDSLDLALNGDGNNLGFLQIIDEFGITKAANLANYYAGAAYLKQGKYELARLYLEDFSANDLLVQGHAYALIGDSYMEEQKYKEAADYYTKAANYKPNKYYSPMYMMKEALAYEKLNDTAKAKELYQTIIDKYWDSAEVQNAKRFKARLDSNS